jgi:DNA polymerase III delta subunit
VGLPNYTSDPPLVYTGNAMLYLLHGENVGASRQALVDLKKNYAADSISVFDTKKFDEDEFARVCETPSLLSDRRLIVVEGKLPQSAISNQQLTISNATDVVFWLGEEVKPSNKLFKLVKSAGGQIRHFRPTIPKHVFGFLDALGYKNKQKSFLELHRLLDQGESSIYLLTMIAWQMRNLLRVKLYNGGGPKPKAAPFVLRKAKSQVKNFEEEELVEVFHKLLEAEIALKTTPQEPKLVLDMLVKTIVNC